MESAADKAAALTADLPPPVPRVWPDARQDVLNQRARGYGLVRMPEMQLYLDGLLARIKKQAGVPEWPGSVQILATAPLDAYATAAGNIYISQSWLASMESEDEVVALLSHEFGHIYLHYHQLEGAVQATDTAASVTAFAVALATKSAQAKGWTAVDSLTASYVAGRDLVSSAWGRSQESAADTFGMNISMKLGYSYEAGFKTFLERMASWEEDSAKRQAEVAKALLAQVQADAAQAIKAKNENPNSDVAKAMYEPFAQLNVALTTIFHEGSTGISSLWRKSTARHPDTVARMDSLAAAVDVMPPDVVPSGDAKTAPWLKARAQKRTAQILSNYAASTRAISNLEDPGALKDAQTGAAGATATHAFPLNVLYQAQLASASRQSNLRNVDPGGALDRNIKVEADRAWLSYVERATQLRQTGRGRDAEIVMDNGFSYFHDAADAWPQAIAFYGETRGWETAKKLAADCKRRFSSVAEACDKAAASPAEKAEAKRQSQVKAEQFVNRLIGK